MRFFIKLVLGMVLFNAFVILLTPLFPNNQQIISSYATNVSAQYGQNYSSGLGLDKIILTVVTDGWFLSIFLIISAAGGIFGLLTGRNSPMFIGISILIGLIAALYIGTIKIFSSLASQYPLVLGLLSITTLVIGIYFVISIANVLTGRSDTD